MEESIESRSKFGKNTVQLTSPWFSKQEEMLSCCCVSALDYYRDISPPISLITFSTLTNISNKKKLVGKYFGYKI
jgi:hypothetical protein